MYCRFGDAPEERGMMKLKRFVTSAVVAGSLLATMASGVGATASDNANCVGQFFSSGIVTSQQVAQGAHLLNGIGHLAGPAASSDSFGLG
jgi:hypothetical protein